MGNNGLRRGKFSKWLSFGLSLTLMTGLLAACSGDSGSSGSENRVIRIGVLYGGSDNEPYFRQQYTDTYEIMHPNITFEIVGAVNYDDRRFETYDPEKPSEEPDPYEKMKEMLTGSNPVDVVVIDYSMLRRFTQDNLLQPLDPLIQKDKFDLSDYVPTVIEGIKAVGDNQIYALTPTFSSSALYYNKKIFIDKGVEPPADMMEWSDVLNKAREVSDGEGLDRTFGFAFNRWSTDGFSGVQQYISSLGLRMYDDNAEKMMVNSDGWKDAWETVTALYRDDIIPDQDYMNLYYEKLNESGGNDPFYGDLFAQGKVAMMIDGSYYVNELKRYSDNAAKIKDYEPLDWDVVTLPMHPSNPGVGGNIGLSQLMGINAKAPNAEDAWDFIKFMNGRDWAKMKSRSQYELVARKEFLQPIGGLSYNIDAFTKLRPLPPATVDENTLYQKNPHIWEAQHFGYMLFQDVMSGNKEVAEALAEWETKGNAALAGKGMEGDGGVIVEPMPFTEEELLRQASGEDAAEATEAPAVDESTEEAAE